MLPCESSWKKCLFLIVLTPMKILGIETSCDETAVSVLEVNPPSRKASEGTVRVLSSVVSSQVKLHAKYGGVVPNLAAREHVKNISHVFKLALKKADESVKHSVFNIVGKTTSYGIKEAMKKIDLIAVTRGPGLGPALLVGISFAQAIAWKYQKPLIGINHLEGHIFSNWLKPVGEISKSESLISKQAQKSRKRDLKTEIFPILNLIVSGGHTELVLMAGYEKYKIIGETLDDAVGEAFNKGARLLGLGSPGGPAVSKIAEQGDSARFPLPRPMLHSKNFDFSFSGLKTAVLYLLRDLKESSEKINKQTKADVAASFQESAVDVLIQKTINATKEFGVDSIMLSGGVSANALLRFRFRKIAEDMGVRYSRPHITYTGDNAAMIAVAGYFKVKSKNEKVKTDWASVKMDANLGF